VLIGAHVSTAGGLVNAVARGVEIGCRSIQVFPQSPRMWRPTSYTDSDFAEFREAMAASSLRSVVIHAIYLVNCASKEAEVKKNSRAALEHSLRVADGIGADGVVLHAGARKGEPHRASVKRAGRMIARALEGTDSRILLENTAGTQGPLGRDMDELADLIDIAGGGDQLGACLDCCHLLAAGYEVRTAEALAEVMDEFDAKVGAERLRCVHVNDSKVGLGANRDLHAALGEGELGERGLATFLSEPRFDDLPAILEGPSLNGGNTEGPDVELAKRLRARGRAARRRRARNPG
jgi:deoxyribonuclease IV